IGDFAALREEHTDIASSVFAKSLPCPLGGCARAVRDAVVGHVEDERVGPARGIDECLVYLRPLRAAADRDDGAVRRADPDRSRAEGLGFERRIEGRRRHRAGCGLGGKVGGGTESEGKKGDCGEGCALVHGIFPLKTALELHPYTAVEEPTRYAIAHLALEVRRRTGRVCNRKLLVEHVLYAQSYVRTERLDVVREGDIVIYRPVELMLANASGRRIDRVRQRAFTQLGRERGAVLEDLADVRHVPHGREICGAPVQAERAPDLGDFVGRVTQLLHRMEAGCGRGRGQVLDERSHERPVGRNAKVPEEGRTERIAGVDVYTARLLSSNVLLNVVDERDRAARESDEIAVLRTVLVVTLIEYVLARHGPYLIR